MIKLSLKWWVDHGSLVHSNEVLIDVFCIDTALGPLYYFLLTLDMILKSQYCLVPKY